MDICRTLSRKLDIGDWWLIYMLGRNLDPVIYKDVMGEFAKQVEPSKHDRAKWAENSDRQAAIEREKERARARDLPRPFNTPLGYSWIIITIIIIIIII